MQPRELRTEHFKAYPPLAQKLVLAHLPALKNLPLSFLPSLLREAIEYDYKFPAERRALDRELANLDALTPAQHAEWFVDLEKIQISPSLEKLDWVNQPAQFVEQLSAHLWTTHQQDAFRKAATEYGNKLQAAVPAEGSKVPRVGITIVGQGVAASDHPLFRKLRANGAFYTNVNPEGGLRTLLDFAAARAKSQPAPFAHWYIDGGRSAEFDRALTHVSYDALEPARNALLARMQKHSETAGNGPENLRSAMAAMKPAELHMDENSDPVLTRFELKLLTEGSGTQIFSTTFAQWAARETLRRAQPLTLVVRFAPRQRQRPMNEMLSVPKAPLELDPAGSLVDGDMGAYYNWLNQQRLPGAAQASFLAWFEDHSTAIAIGPTVPRGTTSAARADLKQILSWTV